MGAFFLPTSFSHETHQLALRTDTVTSLFFLFLLFTSLSPLQSMSTSTCPLCAPNYSINKQYTVQSTSRPLVGLSIYLHKSFPLHVVVIPPVLSRARISRSKGKDGIFIQGSRAGVVDNSHHQHGTAWDRSMCIVRPYVQIACSS